MRAGRMQTSRMSFNPFQRQQFRFDISPECVTDKAAVGSDYPVAGDHYRNRIAAYRIADGLCGHPLNTSSSAIVFAISP